MATQITQGIKISVETFYRPGQSRPLQNEYLFAYKINIENFGDFSIKLLKRFWTIIDSNGLVKTVEGEGVVGEQPVIEAGGSYQYVSGCNLQSEMGKMRGEYTVEKLVDGRQFKVTIPEFLLVAPLKLN